MTGRYEKHVAKKAKKLRIDQGLSQEDVSKMMGFSQQRYFKIENALVYLRVSDLYTLARVLGVKPCDLLEGIE